MGKENIINIDIIYYILCNMKLKGLLHFNLEILFPLEKKKKLSPG